MAGGDTRRQRKAEAVAERYRCDHRVNEQLSLPMAKAVRPRPARTNAVSPVTGDNVGRVASTLGHRGETAGGAGAG